MNDNDGTPDMEQTSCKCTKKDFECDVGFFRDESGKCNRFGYDPDKPKKCEGTYMGKAGFRKIRASECKDGEDWESKQEERQCGSRKEVESKVTAFKNRYEYGQDTVFYFPNSDVSVLRLRPDYERRRPKKKKKKKVGERKKLTGCRNNCDTCYRS